MPLRGPGTPPNLWACLYLEWLSSWRCMDRLLSLLRMQHNKQTCSQRVRLQGHTKTILVTPSLRAGNVNWIELNWMWNMGCPSSIVGQPWIISDEVSQKVCRLSLRYRVRNEHILDMCKIETVRDLVSYHRLQWLGRVARMNDDRVPKQLNSIRRRRLGNILVGSSKAG